MFKPDEVRDAVEETSVELRPDGSYFFEKNQYDSDGFLIKQLRADKLITENVKVRSHRSRFYVFFSCRTAAFFALFVCSSIFFFLPLNLTHAAHTRRSHDV